MGRLTVAELAEQVSAQGDALNSIVGMLEGMSGGAPAAGIATATTPAAAPAAAPETAPVSGDWSGTLEVAADGITGGGNVHFKSGWVSLDDAGMPGEKALVTVYLSPGAARQNVAVRVTATGKRISK